MGKFTARAKIRDLTFFFMVSHTQTLEGITSKCPDGKHYLFWDIEGCTFEQCHNALRKVKAQYNITHDIYVTSDAKYSYRAWCFEKRTFEELLKILLDTRPFLDWNFFYWTVNKGEATLRTSRKKGRPEQEVLAIIGGEGKTRFPTKIKYVKYDTLRGRRRVFVQINAR